jgi:hypothetical protein
MVGSVPIWSASASAPAATDDRGAAATARRTPRACPVREPETTWRADRARAGALVANRRPTAWRLRYEPTGIRHARGSAVRRHPPRRPFTAMTGSAAIDHMCLRVGLRAGWPTWASATTFVCPRLHSRDGQIDDAGTFRIVPGEPELDLQRGAAVLHLTPRPARLRRDVPLPDVPRIALHPQHRVLARHTHGAGHDPRTDNDRDTRRPPRGTHVDGP